MPSWGGVEKRDAGEWRSGCKGGGRRGEGSGRGRPAGRERARAPTAAAAVVATPHPARPDRRPRRDAVAAAAAPRRRSRGGGGGAPPRPSTWAAAAAQLPRPPRPPSCSRRHSRNGRGRASSRPAGERAAPAGWLQHQSWDGHRHTGRGGGAPACLPLLRVVCAAAPRWGGPSSPPVSSLAPSACSRLPVKHPPPPFLDPPSPPLPSLSQQPLTPHRPTRTGCAACCVYVKNWAAGRAWRLCAKPANHPPLSERPSAQPLTKPRCVMACMP